MSQSFTADWSKKPFDKVLPVLENYLDQLTGAATLNIDPKDWSFQVFTNSRPIEKVGKDKYFPHCRFAPSYLTKEQVVARLQEWKALSFNWETELVEFKQIRIVRHPKGFLWCSQRMEHYPTGYLHKALAKAGARVSATPKPYEK